MDYISVICIAIGLAMDAFAVSVSNGATTKNLKLPYSIKLSLFFGGFQFLMPVIGWFVGKAGEGFISQVDHWVAFVLLGFIGGKMIADYIKEKKEEISTEKKERLSNRTIFVLAIATSIDALATGVILPSAVGASTYKLMLVSVIIIGVITFIICMLGVYLGKLFGVLLSRYSTIFGGTVLILIGGKILFEHLILK